MNDDALRLGSRASPLARWQAHWVADRLEARPELVWVRSEGDRDRRTALPEMGGSGVFTAALHEALLADRVDAAVHSLKDLPAEEEAGIALACVPVREDVRDALVTTDGRGLADLPEGARVGTGSPRRAAQLRRARPDLSVEGVRGNVDTRLAFVREGRLDAVVLAHAGLLRLGKDDVIAELLDPDLCLPAAAQGALGITIRRDDERAAGALARLRDPAAEAATTAERAALRALGAGCHAPVGALARVVDDDVSLRVRVLSMDGQTALEETGQGPVAEARELGRAVAARLLEAGAGPLVAP